MLQRSIPQREKEGVADDPVELDIVGAAAAYSDYRNTHFQHVPELMVAGSLPRKLAAVSAIEESVACAGVHH